MLLRSGGMDVFYIDESHDKTVYCVTAIAVPFMRHADNLWRISWPDYLAAAKNWRRAVVEEHKIPASKELHGWKLVSGRGNYLYGKRKLPLEKAAETYRGILEKADFIPPASVITVAGVRGRTLYGHERLERVMHALFQRMRRQCVDRARSVNGMIFFDEGHPEYRSLYRRATVNLPTGSLFGPARNLPLDMFVEDGNFKNSKHCHFTQLADLISYAALAKVRHERKLLDPDQEALGIHTIYDGVPDVIKNLNAGGRDGIVRIG
jgi:hypothetical protein